MPVPFPVRDEIFRPSSPAPWFQTSTYPLTRPSRSGDEILLRLAEELEPVSAVFVTDVAGVYTGPPHEEVRLPPDDTIFVLRPASCSVGLTNERRFPPGWGAARRLFNPLACTPS